MVHMKGSLDNPPIIICASRWKSAFYLLICSGFVAIDAAALIAVRPQPWWAWLGLVFFGFGIPLFLWRFVRPDTLELSPEGILWRSLWRVSSWSWGEVTGFRPIVVSLASRHVGFDFTDRKVATQLRAINAGLAGMEGSLGAGWELGPERLAELLNSARAKWVLRAIRDCDGFPV